MSQHDSAFWAATMAKYYTWPSSQMWSGQMEGWPDPTPPSITKHLKQKLSLHKVSDRRRVGVSFFFMIIILHTCLKNVQKIPNSNLPQPSVWTKVAQITPRWEDSFQQRLIKIFNSSTLNNSLCGTVAARRRQTFVVTFCHVSSCCCLPACLAVRVEFVGDNRT